jgi:hypothetical protein
MRYTSRYSTIGLPLLCHLPPRFLIVALTRLECHNSPLASERGNGAIFGRITASQYLREVGRETLCPLASPV